jgi:molecular chaperone GrpE
MTKRNRKDTVGQENHQSEEASDFKPDGVLPDEVQNEIAYTDGTDTIESAENNQAEPNPESDSPGEENSLKIIESKLAEMNDKYLRLSAEFDNYRKRTMRERAELIKSAGEDILSNILPVLDNFERALTAIKSSNDPDAIKEGILLIYGKFKDFLSQRGIKEIDTLNKPFDSELHDAITKFPVSSKDQQGIVIDVVEKGYYLNDKIIRHSKVVVGEYTDPGTSGELN